MKKSIEQKAADLVSSSGKKDLSLESRQSVRTTFNLTKKTSEEIKSLVKERGITVKELFEILCFDIYDVLNELFYSEGFLKDRWKEMERQVRKTYVISMRTSARLTELSKEQKIPRDILVEHLISTYKHVDRARRERTEKSKKNHKKALRIMEDFNSVSYEIWKKLKNILIEEDPIMWRFGLIDTVINNLTSDIKAELEDGNPIDADQM